MGMLAPVRAARRKGSEERWVVVFVVGWRVRIWVKERGRASWAERLRAVRGRVSSVVVGGVEGADVVSSLVRVGRSSERMAFSRAGCEEGGIAALQEFRGQKGGAMSCTV